jgi:hypothetical protein
MTDDEYKIKSIPKIPDNPREALALLNKIIEKEKQELEK